MARARSTMLATEEMSKYLLDLKSIVQMGRLKSRRENAYKTVLIDTAANIIVLVSVISKLFLMRTTKRTSDRMAVTEATTAINFFTSRLKISRLPRALGSLRIAPGSLGSNTNAKFIKPSPTMLAHNICGARIGSGNPASIATVTSAISVRPVETK